MSTVLKTILIKLRNLLDKIITKIDKPQPIHFPPLPELNLLTYTTDGNSLNSTCDGTATGINIYSDPK